MKKLKQIIKNESVQTHTGIIREIENTQDELTRITIQNIEPPSLNISIIPIYGKVSQEYLEKFVEIKHYEKGWINKKIEQEIQGTNSTYKTKISKTKANKIRQKNPPKQIQHCNRM